MHTHTLFYPTRTALTMTVCLLALLLLTGALSTVAAQKNFEKLTRFVQTQNASEASAKVFRAGRDFIGEENWKGAVEKFQSFIEQYPKDAGIDAALYWLAFAQFKLDRLTEASSQLQRLLKKYPNSNWADDARALQIQIGSQQGRAVEPSSDDDEEIKIVALESLFRSNPERGLAFVQNMFKPGSNASRHMKEAGIEFIRRFGEEKAVPLLIDIIRNERDAELRKAAIETLGRTGDERAFEILVEMVKTSTDDDVSNAAVFAISRFKSERSHPVLFEMARSAKSVEVRKNAIFYLSREGSDDVLDELMRLYASEPDVEVKKQIVFALRRMNTPRSIAKLYEVASGNGDVEVRKDAIHWIGQRGDAQAIEYLIKTYDAETNEEMKNQIIFGLSRTNQKSALRKLMEIARHDKSLELRKQAVFWLGRSDDPEAAQFLEDILK
ncbi:MAG: HEAT repeat domain-containing protein [Acidobacteria bacterium]|nr:HEAT repeat domain-containing protein [Acidobacteriota bacterium]